MRLKLIFVVSLALAGAASAAPPPAPSQPSTDPEVTLRVSELNQINEILLQQNKVDAEQEKLNALNLKYAGAVQKLNSQIRPPPPAPPPPTLGAEPAPPSAKPTPSPSPAPSPAK